MNTAENLDFRHVNFRFPSGMETQHSQDPEDSHDDEATQRSQDPEDGHDDEAKAENMDMGMFPCLET